MTDKIATAIDKVEATEVLTSAATFDMNFASTGRQARIVIPADLKPSEELDLWYGCLQVIAQARQIEKAKDPASKLVFAKSLT